VKICRHCKAKAAKGKQVCPKCGKSLNKDISDWRELLPGDKIKALAKSGPYFEGENGKTYLGYSGKCIIKRVEDNGLLVHTPCGTDFLYMGEKEEGIVGIKEAYKIQYI